jgi:hypothetical protein
MWMRGLDNRIVTNPNIFSDVDAPPPIKPDPRRGRTGRNPSEDLQNPVS